MNSRILNFDSEGRGLLERGLIRELSIELNPPLLIEGDY